MFTNPGGWRRLFGTLGLLLIIATPTWADMAAAWSPDGQTIALLLTDARQSRQWISFWDAKSERRRGSDIIAPAGVRYTNLAYSHNGQLLAVGRGRGPDGLLVQLFDARYGGQRLQVKQAGEEAAEVLGFNSDDSVVLVRFTSGRVAAVSVLTGEVRTSFGTATRAVISPDGRWLGLVDTDKIRALDLSGQYAPLTFAVPGVSRIAFGVDGETLAAVVPDGVTSWRLSDQRQLFHHPMDKVGSDVALVYGVDRHSLIVRVGDTLSLLDRDLGGQRAVVAGVEAGAPLLLNDPLNRERLLVGGGKRLPLFWNAYFGGHQPFMLDSPRLRGAALSKDGQWLALGGASTLGEAGFLRLLSPAGGAPFDLPGSTRSTGFVGKQLLAADDGHGRLVIWSLADKKLKARVDGWCGGESRIVDSSESAGLVLLRCEQVDGSIFSELRDATGAVAEHWAEPAIGMSASGKLLAFRKGTGAEILQRELGLRRPVKAQDAYNADRAVFSRDDLTYVLGDDQTGALFVYERGAAMPRLSLVSGFTGRITAEAMGWTGTQVFAVADGGLQRRPQPVRSWDIGSGSRRAPTEFAGGHTGPVLAILPMADGGRFITVGEDGAVRQWEPDGRNRPLLQPN